MFDLIQSVPSWVLDWSGSILTMIGLYFYAFNLRNAWHWSNAGLVPYTLLFAATAMWPLFWLQVCFILFGLHGYVLWYLQDHGSKFVSKWQFLTTPIAVGLLGLAYFNTVFTDAWAYVQFTIVAFSIVASWGLARRFAWFWLVWLPANVLGFFYYAHSELWSLMIIQIPLFLFSVYGYWEWTRGETSKKGLVVSREGNVERSEANELMI